MRTLTIVLVTMLVLAGGLFGAVQGGLLPQLGLIMPAMAAPNVPHPDMKLPRMALEGQYNGPLQDTLIQRWRDPVDGTVCYVYLPVTVKHDKTPTGFVGYGNNTIGSITCLPNNGRVAMNVAPKPADVSEKANDAKPVKDALRKSSR